MMTVRSPTGFSIVYNDAHHVYRRAEYTDLYKDENQQSWVAQVPNSWVIELVRPWRVYDAAHAPADVAKAFLQELRNRSNMYGYTLADIKSELTAFDGRKKRWK